VTIVSVICESDKTNLTNFWGDQNARPLYLTIGIIGTDIWWTPKKHAWILVGLIPCHPKDANHSDEAWHNAVGTVLAQLKYLNITGLGLKGDRADGLQR